MEARCRVWRHGVEARYGGTVQRCGAVRRHLGVDDVDGLVMQDVADLVQQFLVVLPRAADDGDDLLVVELGQLVRHLHLALVDDAHLVRARVRVRVRG